MLVVCFSKDRPLQLEGYLRSLKDAADCNTHVFYKASTPEMEEAYREVGARHYPARLHPETNLKEQVTHLVQTSETKLMMFGCDDVIFTGKVGEEAFKRFEDDYIFGFSMRLGRNTTYCHPANQYERLTAAVWDHDGTGIWNWHIEHGVDFRYPFELNATIYRREDVMKYFRLIQNLDSWHPNILEGVFYRPEIVREFERPYMASYQQSRAYTITVNRVQDVSENRIYNKNEKSPDELLRLYKEGWRVNLGYYTDKVYNSVHIGDLELEKV